MVASIVPQDMNRLVSLLGAEILATLLEVVVVQVPVDRRPGVVLHPVDGCERGGVLIGVPGFEERAFSLVVQQFGALRVIGDVGGCTKATVYRIGEDREVIKRILAARMI